MRNSLQDLLARFEPSKHNGAPLPGLRGVVVNGHGNSDRNALVHALKEAVAGVERQVPPLIESMINDYSIEGDL
jgi:fatty acid/phospholipid biosynthesis enzyme